MVDLSKRRNKNFFVLFLFRGREAFISRKKEAFFFSFFGKNKRFFFFAICLLLPDFFFSLLFQRGFLQTWALFYRKPGKGFIYVLRFYSRRNLLASRFTRVPLKKNASLEDSRIHSKTPSFFLKIFREPLPPFSLAPKIKMLLPPKM